MVCPTWVQFWGGTRAGDRGTLPRAPPCAVAHLFLSIVGRHRQPQILVAHKLQRSSGDTLRFCGDPGHVLLRHPLPAPPGAQPASLCSAIFKTPKESSHLRLLETWRIPPAIRRSQEPCSFSNPPELASDIKPNKQTERGLLCKKSSSELVISGL